MINLFKLWAAVKLPYTWNSELEKYIALRNPKTHQDLELAIRDFERTIGVAL